MFLGNRQHIENAQIFTLHSLLKCFHSQSLPEGSRIIRSMPNSPVAVGYGATVICKGHYAKDDDPIIACKWVEF